MTTSAWFDYNGYMANKLTQVEKAEPTAGWDMMKLVKAFSDAGFAGAIGAEQHFEQFGQYEDVAPNAFFNPTEYFRAKAAQFYGKDPKAVTDLDVASIQLAIKDAGMSAWSHYEQFGNTEKVNPSNSFDTEAYMNAKLTALNSVKDGKQYTLPEVYAAFKAAGLSALEHFMLFGGNGDGEVAQKYDPAKPAIPTEFAVPDDKKVNGGGSDGNFIELTGKIDNLQGTTGNDVFVGTATTSQAMDSISGNGGEDILRLDNVNASALPGVIKGVQTFSFENNIASLTKDLSTYADLKHVVVKDAAVTVLTVAAGVDMAYTGTLTGNQTVNFKGTDGKEDAATLKFNDATFTGNAVVSGASAGEGIETLNLEVIGANKIGTLTNAAMQTLSISGAGSLKATLATTAAKLATIESTALGNVDLDLSASGVLKGAGEYSVKTGAGDDTITLAQADFLKNAKIDLGDGWNTVVAKASGAVTPTKDMLSSLTNVDELGFISNTTSAVTLDAAFTDINNFSFTGDNVTAAGAAIAITNAQNDATLTFKGSVVTSGTNQAFAASSFGATTQPLQKALNVIFEAGAATNAHVDLDAGTGLTIDVANINVENTKVKGSTVTNANDVLLTVINQAGINVKGDHDLTLTFATGTALAVNAEGFSGKFDVTGTTGADIITGGKGHNIVTGGNGVDTIDLAASKGVHDAVGLTGILAAANGDIFKGFEVGATTTADTVFLNTAAALTGGADITLNAVVEGGKLTLATSASASTVNEFAKDIGADAKTGAGVVGHLDAVTTFSAGDDGHLVVYGEGNAYLYAITLTGTTVAQGDLKLIGTFEGVAAGGFENGNVVW